MTANIDVLVENKIGLSGPTDPYFSRHVTVTTPFFFFFFLPDFHSVNNSEFPRHLTSKH